MGENMKKVIAFILMFFIGIVGINAKDFNNFACDYNLTLSSQGDNGITEAINFGKVQVQVQNYKSSNPNVIIFYTNNNGELVKYTRPTLDYKGEDNRAMYLRFFTTNNKNDFVESFKNNSLKCPDLVTNFLSDMNSIDIELHTLFQDENNSWTNSSNKLLLYDEETKEWKNDKDFYKENNIEDKESRVCEYTMKFDLFPQKLPIKLTTNYEAGTNKKTYELKVNGNKATFTDFSSDQTVMMGTGTGAMVRVSAEQLKKLYSSDECPTKEEIFSYLDGELSTDGVYNITTDEEEAKNNGTAGRYDQAGNPFPTTGGNGGGGNASDPTLDEFGNPKTSCSEVLGPTLTALVKEAIKWVRIAGAIIAIVNAMLKLIPAIMSKDAEALNKAIKTCITMAIILVFCVLFSWLLNLIGILFKWDVSCIV